MVTDKDYSVEALIENMTREYIEKQGCVTCEFSIGNLVTPYLMEFFVEANRSLALSGLNAAWYCFHCSTCKGYNKETPVHCEITNLKQINW